MSKTVHITVPVTVELRERIVAAAHVDRRSMSAWIRILIEDRLTGGAPLPSLWEGGGEAGRLRGGKTE